MANFVSALYALKIKKMYDGAKADVVAVPVEKQYANYVDFVTRRIGNAYRMGVEFASVTVKQLYNISAMPTAMSERSVAEVIAELKLSWAAALSEYGTTEKSERKTSRALGRDFDINGPTMTQALNRFRNRLRDGFNRALIKSGIIGQRDIFKKYLRGK